MVTPQLLNFLHHTNTVIHFTRLVHNPNINSTNRFGMDIPQFREISE